MTHYKIAITRWEERGRGLVCVKDVRIVCNTPYILTRDIPEWIREEVDPNAMINDNAMEEE